MSDNKWYVPAERNAWFGLKYRAQRVVHADFGGVGVKEDNRTFWCRDEAQDRASRLNRLDMLNKKVKQIYGE